MDVEAEQTKDNEEEEEEEEQGPLGVWLGLHQPASCGGLTGGFSAPPT